MSIERLGAEQEALRSLLALLEQAERCRQLYDRAGMSAPEPLRRILGLTEAVATAPPPRVTVPAPEAPPRPAEAQPGWIWIAAKDASATSGVLAALRADGKPVRAKDVITRVQALQPDTNTGSIPNIGNRLDGKGINRGEEGWTLKSPDLAPIAKDGFFWGPPSIFNKHELAAHRRYGIIHLLRMSPSGLQTTQIVEQLLACPWLHAPVNKELVQADVEWLVNNENKIRRRGNSRKWELVPEERSGQ